MAGPRTAQRRRRWIELTPRIQKHRDAAKGRPIFRQGPGRRQGPGFLWYQPAVPQEHSRQGQDVGCEGNDPLAPQGRPAGPRHLSGVPPDMHRSRQAPVNRPGFTGERHGHHPDPKEWPSLERGLSRRSGHERDLEGEQALRPSLSRKRLTGYHTRSRTEAQMRRLKSFSERIIARDPDRQAVESHTRVALMNRFSVPGRAENVLAG